MISRFISACYIDSAFLIKSKIVRSGYIATYYMNYSRMQKSVRYLVYIIKKIANKKFEMELQYDR